MQERQQEHLIRRSIEGVVLLALHPRACITVIVQVHPDELFEITQWLDCCLVDL